MKYAKYGMCILGLLIVLSAFAFSVFLNASERELRACYGEITDIQIYENDVGGNITFINKDNRELTVYSPDVMLYEVGDNFACMLPYYKIMGRTLVFPILSFFIAVFCVIVAFKSCPILRKE